MQPRGTRNLGPLSHGRSHNENGIASHKLFMTTVQSRTAIILTGVHIDTSTNELTQNHILKVTHFLFPFKRIVSTLDMARPAPFYTSVTVCYLTDKARQSKEITVTRIASTGAPKSYGTSLYALCAMLASRATAAIFKNVPSSAQKTPLAACTFLLLPRVESCSFVRSNRFPLKMSTLYYSQTP